MHVYAPCACLMPTKAKRAYLILQTWSYEGYRPGVTKVMNHSVVAGNQTQVLCKGNKCPNHLSISIALWSNEFWVDLQNPRTLRLAQDHCSGPMFWAKLCLPDQEGEWIKTFQLREVEWCSKVLPVLTYPQAPTGTEKEAEGPVS